jgi:hypothetical protein
VPPAYDCLTNLGKFICAYPPVAESPLLSGLGYQISSDCMLVLLHKLADKYGFARDRMKMHSSIRSGALVALENEADHIKERQGCWRSTEGMLNYLRGTLQHAAYVTDQLHDPSLCPISLTQMTFSPAFSGSI